MSKKKKKNPKKINPRREKYKKFSKIVEKEAERKKLFDIL